MLTLQLASGAIPFSSCNGFSSPVVSQQEHKDSITGFGAEMQQQRHSQQKTVDKEKSVENPNPKEEDNFQECLEHNLPDSPFASPTKSAVAVNTGDSNHLGLPVNSPSPTTSLNSCFFQVPPRTWQRPHMRGWPAKMEAPEDKAVAPRSSIIDRHLGPNV